MLNWSPDPTTLAVLRAAVLAVATEGCELEDCADKAVVLFYVQEALSNVTNAYLAFSTVSDSVLYSEDDFQERAAVFAETLQEVANLNANLTDYFVREACLSAVAASLPACPPLLPASQPACLPACLHPARLALSPAASLHLLHTCQPRAPAQVP